MYFPYLCSELSLFGLGFCHFQHKELFGKDHLALHVHLCPDYLVMSWYHLG